MLVDFPEIVAGEPCVFFFEPWQLLLVILAGWVNPQQQQVIECLRTENQVLKEMLGRKRMLFNDRPTAELASSMQTGLLRALYDSGIPSNPFFTSSCFVVDVRPDRFPRSLDRSYNRLLSPTKGFQRFSRPIVVSSPWPG